MHFSAIFLIAFKLFLGEQAIDTEIVSTPEARAKGLMGREVLSDDEGMLFVFQKPQILHFHMKGTKIPLAIGFFDENQVLIEWQEMDIPLESAVVFKNYSSSKPALYALEVPKGWFQRKEIKKGMAFSLEKAFKDP